MPQSREYDELFTWEQFSKDIPGFMKHVRKVVRKANMSKEDYERCTGGQE